MSKQKQHKVVNKQLGTNKIKEQYERLYVDELSKAIDLYSLAIAYTLHFNEDTKMGPNELPGFMEDIFSTVDMFRTGEYKPEEYLDELAKCGIIMTKNEVEKASITLGIEYKNRCEKALDYLNTNSNIDEVKEILLGNK